MFSRERSPGISLVFILLEMGIKDQEIGMDDNNNHNYNYYLVQLSWLRFSTEGT